MDRALEAGRQASALFPDNLLYANNLALYALYASDFERAERGARAALEINPTYGKALVALGLSLLAQGKVEEAKSTYQRLATDAPSARETSWAAIGLADVALYTGDVSRAVEILLPSIAGDLANERSGAAARKQVMLARAYFLQGRQGEATDSGRSAAAASARTSVLVSAALLHVEAGRLEDARAIVEGLARRIHAEPRAYARVIDGEILMKTGDYSSAIRNLREAEELADTWLGRYGLGRAYLGAEAYAEAHAELEKCVRRSGEAAAIFLDDIPSYHTFPDVYYYLGRAQEGLGSAGASRSYESYVAIRGESAEDPLIPDARLRLDRARGDAQ